MKIVIEPGKKKAQAGNILIWTLVISGIIGITLMAYLNLVSTQHRQVARSQSWNSLMPVIEAGIEEAVAHLNTYGGGDRAVNGWKKVTRNGTNYFHMSRDIDLGRYEVLIGTNTPPRIVSRGFVDLPTVTNEVTRGVVVQTELLSGLFVGIVAKGAVSMGPGSMADSFNSADPNYSTFGKYDPAKNKDNGFVGSVHGAIKGGGSSSTTILGSVGTGPFGSVGTITVGDEGWVAGGNTGVQDGHYRNDMSLDFPEVAPPFSGPGAVPGTGTEMFEDYTYSSDSITTNVFPNPSPTNAVTTNVITMVTETYPSSPDGPVTTNEVTETSATWPGSSYAPITTNTVPVVEAKNPPPDGTYVGEVKTVTETKGNKTYTYYNYNEIVDYTYDKTTYSYKIEEYTYDETTVTTNMISQHFAYVLDSGNYESSSVSVSGDSQILVKGDAVWYVPGGFSMTGNASLRILPGASLQLYVGGTEGRLAGNGVNNMDGDALSFEYFGLPSNTTVTLAGNGEFIGTVYAPNATLKGAGGGSDVQDFSGAGIFDKVDYAGHVNFHYDEKLGAKSSALHYRIASWDEL